MAIVQQYLHRLGSQEYFVAFLGSTGKTLPDGANNWPWNTMYDKYLTFGVSDYLITDDGHLYIAGQSSAFAGGWQTQWDFDSNGNHAQPYGGHISKLKLQNKSYVWAKYLNDSNASNITGGSGTGWGELALDSGGNIWAAAVSDANNNQQDHYLCFARWNSSGTRSFLKYLGSDLGGYGGTDYAVTKIFCSGTSMNIIGQVLDNAVGYQTPAACGSRNLVFATVNSSASISAQYTYRRSGQGNNNGYAYETYFNSAIEDSSGNYIGVGRDHGPVTSYSDCSALQGNKGAWIAKLNSSGAIQWQKHFIYDSGYFNNFDDVGLDSSNNIYAVGALGYHTGANNSGRYGFLVKYNSSGSVQWVRRFPVGKGADRVAVNPDNSDEIFTLHTAYITFSYGGNNYTNIQCAVLIKFNSSGSMQWQRTLLLTNPYGSVNNVFSSDLQKMQVKEGGVWIVINSLQRPLKSDANASMMIKYPIDNGSNYPFVGTISQDVEDVAGDFKVDVIDISTGITSTVISSWTESNASVQRVTTSYASGDLLNYNNGCSSGSPPICFPTGQYLEEGNDSVEFVSNPIFFH